MSRIYTIAFRMGVLFNVLLWAILNVLSFTANRIEYENRGIGFAPAGFKWGVPFDWDAKYFVIEGAGAILNIIIMAACGFAFGFLFKFVWSMISRRGAELNGTPSS